MPGADLKMVMSAPPIVVAATAVLLFGFGSKVVVLTVAVFVKAPFVTLIRTTAVNITDAPAGNDPILHVMVGAVVDGVHVPCVMLNVSGTNSNSSLAGMESTNTT